MSDDDDNVRPPDKPITMRLNDFDSEPGTFNRPLTEEEQIEELMEQSYFEQIEKQIMKDIIADSKRINLDDLLQLLKRIKTTLESKYIEDYDKLITNIEIYIESEDDFIYYQNSEEYKFITFLIEKTILRKSDLKIKLINLIKY